MVLMIVRLGTRHNACRHFARLYAIFLLIALLPGGAHAGPLEGYWYGQGYQAQVNKTLQWLTINRSDGTYSVEFREYRKCKLVFAQKETGRWTVSGDVITKKTLTVSGQPVSDTAYYTDTYKIIELNEPIMSIIHEKTGQNWMLERVTEDFTFPDCKHVS